MSNATYQGQLLAPLSLATVTTTGLLWAAAVPGVVRLRDGLRISFFSPEAASGLALQVATNGLTAKPLLRSDLTLPKQTDIASANIIVEAIYSLTLDAYIMTQSNVSAPTYNGFKNRIINGDMRIDQRNSGSMISVASTGNTYSLDRWEASGQLTDGVFTFGQRPTGPSGYSNFLRSLVGTADASIAAGQIYQFGQHIEGYNVADLNFGSATASPICLSFWVRSSIAGLYPVSFKNGANDRSYLTSFTINATNVWEYKTILVPGDTTGTWAVDNSAGLKIQFSLGCGSTFKGTANTWQAGNLFSATSFSAVDLISTNGATLDITGVQLEKGAIPTAFENRAYSNELNLCQRYYEKSYDISTAAGSVTASNSVHGAGGASGLKISGSVSYRTEKRSTPTVLTWDTAGNSSTFSQYLNGTYTTNVGSVSILDSGSKTFIFNRSNDSVGWALHFTSSAEF